MINFEKAYRNIMSSGSSSVSHVSGGDEEVRRLMDKIEKNTLVDGDSDLEVLLINSILKNKNFQVVNFTLLKISLGSHFEI